MVILTMSNSPVRSYTMSDEAEVTRPVDTDELTRAWTNSGDVVSGRQFASSQESSQPSRSGTPLSPPSNSLRSQRARAHACWRRTSSRSAQSAERKTRWEQHRRTHVNATKTSCSWVGVWATPTWRSLLACTATWRQSTRRVRRRASIDSPPACR